MEELEIISEGQTPQPPDAASPDPPEASGVNQLAAESDHAAANPVEETLDSSANRAEAEKGGASETSTAEPGPASPEPIALDPAPPVAVEEAADAGSNQPESEGGEAPDVTPETASPEPVELAPAALVSVEELLASDPEAPAPAAMDDAQLMAVLEAVVYVAEEPLTLAQIAAALQQPAEHVDAVLRQLIAELDKPEHGIAIREVAGGFKMATKAEHHEAVRSFVKSLKPPMKLSLPALETLAVIAYKQPVTAPEIMEIRGVQGTGVLKTLLDRKLIAVAGRKNVIGKPILYKTTRDFLIQFGLNDVSELPSLKEFEDIRRMAFSDSEAAAPEPAAPDPQPVLPEILPEQES